MAKETLQSTKAMASAVPGTNAQNCLRRVFSGPFNCITSDARETGPARRQNEETLGDYLKGMETIQ